MYLSAALATITRQAAAGPGTATVAGYTNPAKASLLRLILSALFSMRARSSALSAAASCDTQPPPPPRARTAEGTASTQTQRKDHHRYHHTPRHRDIDSIIGACIAFIQNCI